MNSAVNSLERIGDIFYQISKIFEKKNTEGIEFSESQNKKLIEMFDLIEEAFKSWVKIFRNIFMSFYL